MASRTVLYPFHAANATMGEFGGFEMPLWYEGIVAEVNAVRHGVGVFDVSHMSRTMFSGREAGRFLDYLTTNDMGGLSPMQARYTLLCNEGGGVVDDTIVLRTGGEGFFMFCNASNREKDKAHVRGLMGAFDVVMEDRSEGSFMIALQGPEARAILQPLCDFDLAALKRFWGAKGRVGGIESYVMRTGYTGEDGFEIFSFEGGALDLWRRLVEGGATPAGLGARDVLRIEAGLPLYGHELDETTNPLEARLDFALRMGKGDFVGREALSAAMRDGPRRRLVGIRMTGRGIPRPGYPILHGGQIVGKVTSGTFSPTLGAPVALGFIKGEEPWGTGVLVRIRGSDHEGVLADPPFYDRSKFGWNRKA